MVSPITASGWGAAGMMLRRAIDEDGRASRRVALLDAAERLVADNPLAIPSVAQVAEAAGFAKGTVYLHFSSKESLLDALWEREIEAFFAALADDLDSGRPDRCIHAAERVLAWLADHPVFLVLAALGRGAARDPASVPGADESTARTEVPAAGGTQATELSFATLTPATGASTPGASGIDDAAYALAWRSLALVIGLARLGRVRDIAAAVRALWRDLERNPGNAP